MVKLESETYQTKQHGEACLVDAVATHDPETGRSAVFVVNRSLESPTSFTVDLSRLGEVSILETHTLTDEDIYATNSYEDPDRVRLVPERLRPHRRRPAHGRAAARLLDGHRPGLTASGRNADLAPVTTRGCG